MHSLRTKIIGFGWRGIQRTEIQTFVFFDIHSDASGQAFNRTITQKRWSAPDIGFEMKGVARVTSQGKLILTSQDNFDYAAEVLSLIGQRNPEDLDKLSNVVLIRTENGRFVKVGLSSFGAKWRSRTLVQLQSEGDTALFAFGTSGTAPHLFVRASKGLLKEDIHVHQPFTLMARGQIAVDAKGRLAFRITNPTEALAGELSQFAQNNNITRLKRAYVHIKDTSTGDESRHKLSSDW